MPARYQEKLGIASAPATSTREIAVRLNPFFIARHFDASPLRSRILSELRCLAPSLFPPAPRVSHSLDRHDDLRIGRVTFDLLTKMRNGHVDRSRFRVRLHPPNLFEQL